MKKVIITGSTGMLSLVLINKLLAENIEVLAIVRPNSKRIGVLPKSSMLKILEIDISNINSLCDKVSCKYDVFFHFAWDFTTHEGRDSVYPQMENIKYTLNAMEVAKKVGCTLFIGAGSQAEYGRVSNIISPETPVNPQTAYGIAKYSAYKFCDIFSNTLDIKFIWTRVFSVYGPNDGENTMISTCIKTLLENKTMYLTKCEQMWDYLYSDDSANAFYLIAKYGVDKSVYCIGSGEVRELSYYVKIIKSKIKTGNIELGYREYSKNQVMYLQADISKLTKDTGFIPKVSFDDGILETINFILKK